MLEGPRLARIYRSRVQTRFQPISAALVLVLLHCFLHVLLPMVGMSLVMSWLASGPRGSALHVVLGHNSVIRAFLRRGPSLCCRSQANVRQQLVCGFSRILRRRRYLAGVPGTDTYRDRSRSVIEEAVLSVIGSQR